MIRCPRVGCGGSIVRGDDGPVCLLCGRAPEPVIVRCTVPTKTKEEKTRMPRGVPRNGRPSLTPTEGKPTSPAGDALSRYTQAAGNYIRLRDRVAQLEGQLGELRAECATAAIAMAQARERLDAALSGEAEAEAVGA